MFTAVLLVRKQKCVSVHMNRAEREREPDVGEVQRSLQNWVHVSHLPGVQKLDVVPRFIESVCTLASLFATFIFCTYCVNTG